MLYWTVFLSSPFKATFREEFQACRKDFGLHAATLLPVPAEHAKTDWDAVSWRCRVFKFPHFRLERPACRTAILRLKAWGMGRHMHQAFSIPSSTSSQSFSQPVIHESTPYCTPGPTSPNPEFWDGNLSLQNRGTGSVRRETGLPKHPEVGLRACQHCPEGSVAERSGRPSRVWDRLVVGGRRLMSGVDLPVHMHTHIYIYI